MTALEATVGIIYLVAATTFVLGLHLMRSPATARRGNLLSASGMATAILATVALVAFDDSFHVTAWGWVALVGGTALGGVAGAVSARRVKMTAMPQLVSLFNAVGGGAAAIIAFPELMHRFEELDLLGGAYTNIATSVLIFVGLDLLIGSITFSGSLIAAGKLQGWISGAPITFLGSRVLTLVAAATGVGSVIWLIAAPGMLPLIVLTIAALAFGIFMVLPIGGADMPVVVSLLNAFTGLAVAMSGFVVGSDILIVAGGLVGASGTILTKLMADAMNRSVLSIMVGGFGTGDAPAGAAVASGGEVTRTDADDVALRLAYASKVIIVPGYGLAAAQAQREAGELGKALTERGITVFYAIHPVAGRMPGHMNVLLAEADVPYPQLLEMDDVNPEFSTCDVALVVGANDVTNPAARRAGNAISGMPILDVDKARSIVVIKRSMGHGYAGLDNELYTDPKTGMLFADAKKGLGQILAALKEYAA
ncbi:NAD(P)(+) transhydrogenase (Re/Si-specific) subunit beta [Demequina sp.]|uniref:NAD(P)(+) transhydrogenase (Re/Si-specific) subunit beta n=1 Tax=Demequina sp. TaxID=2050685 RepID=UPI003D13CFFB